jgi:N-acyl-D-aspartate/D-glutamate deacylase
MLDLVLRDAVIVDGTGAPGTHGSIGVRDGRVVAVGDVDEHATRMVTVDGRTVVPGFIDLHTHYDAQLLWDPLCTPSPQHGVTTVIAGNCGMTLAPAGAADREFIVRLLSRVEAIPVDALAAGVEFGWSTYPELLDEIEARGVGVNVGFMVGHAALRRAAMGSAASETAADEDQVRAMVMMLEDALAHGGLGLSTATVATQVDALGRPSPPSFASDEEFLALAETCGNHPGTCIEFIPGSYLRGFDEHDTALVAEMSRRADRHLNWNPVVISKADPDLHRRQLQLSAAARVRGGRVVPFALPANVRLQQEFLDAYVFRALPGWGAVFALAPDERCRALADPPVRARLSAALDAETAGLAVTLRDAWPRFVVNEVPSDAMKHLVGRAIGDLATERGRTPFDTILDVAVEGHLAVGFVRDAYDANDQWARDARAEVLRAPGVVLGGSDAGAHLDMMCGGDYPTRALADLWRAQGLFGFEELVRRLTDEPARLYGLRDRGRIVPGAWADLVVLDPTTVGAGAMRTVRDLPNGAPRLVSDSTGIERVLVAGREVVVGGEPCDVGAGKLLRSGRDTDTVRVT